MKNWGTHEVYSGSGTCIANGISRSSSHESIYVGDKGDSDITYSCSGTCQLLGELLCTKNDQFTALENDPNSKILNIYKDCNNVEGSQYCQQQVDCGDGYELAAIRGGCTLENAALAQSSIEAEPWGMWRVYQPSSPVGNGICMLDIYNVNYKGGAHLSYVGKQSASVFASEQDADYRGHVDIRLQALCIPKVTVSSFSESVPDHYIKSHYCNLNNNNSGCDTNIVCDPGYSGGGTIIYRPVLAKAVCHLEGLYKDIPFEMVEDMPWGGLLVMRPSHIVSHGICRLNDKTITAGANWDVRIDSNQVDANDNQYVKFRASEYDSSGGDPAIGGQIVCAAVNTNTDYNLILEPSDLEARIIYDKSYKQHVVTTGNFNGYYKGIRSSDEILTSSGKKSYKFDGLQSITVHGAEDLSFYNNDIDISISIYPTEYNSYGSGILAMSKHLDTEEFFLFINTDNKLQLNFNADEKQVISTATIPLNTWTNISIKKVNNDISVYINNVEVSEMKIEHYNPPRANYNSLDIGTRYGGSNVNNANMPHIFKGYIGSVYISSSPSDLCFSCPRFGYAWAGTGTMYNTEQEARDACIALGDTCKGYTDDYLDRGWFLYDDYSNGLEEYAEAWGQDYTAYEYGTEFCDIDTTNCPDKCSNNHPVELHDCIMDLKNGETAASWGSGTNEIITGDQSVQGCRDSCANSDTCIIYAFSASNSMCRHRSVDITRREGSGNHEFLNTVGNGSSIGDLATWTVGVPCYKRHLVCSAKLDPCDANNNPCQNGGICSGELGGEATCDCSGTGFTGDNCQHSCTKIHWNYKDNSGQTYSTYKFINDYKEDECNSITDIGSSMAACCSDYRLAQWNNNDFSTFSKC